MNAQKTALWIIMTVLERKRQRQAANMQQKKKKKSGKKCWFLHLHDIRIGNTLWNRRENKIKSQFLFLDYSWKGKIGIVGKAGVFLHLSHWISYSYAHIQSRHLQFTIFSSVPKFSGIDKFSLASRRFILHFFGWQQKMNAKSNKTT